MANTDALISSQATHTKYEPIFIHSDGSAIQVFTEAGGINNRPKLMRKLKNHGASICNDPTNAEIIIVNQDSSQGRHFIRDWSIDESKVVLHELWVKKCIEAGKALLHGDQWGDCIAIDNGSVSDEEEVQIPQKSPLPTPRETPSELHATSLAVSDVDSGTPARQTERRDTSTMSPTLPSASANSSLQTPSLAPYNAMNGIPPSSFMQYPSQMASMFNGATPQQMMAASTMPQQLMSNFMAQQMMTNMSMMIQSSGMPFNPETFSAAVSDAISKYTSGSQPSFRQPARSESPDPEPALPYPVVPPRLSDKVSARKPSWPMSVSSVTQRSPSQSSDTPSTQISSEKKGKSRADAPSAKRRKLSTSSYRDEAINYINASGSNGVASPEKVFQTKSGQELAFFVQIDMHNRFNLVDAIKKNGGRIEKEQELADYAVLYSGHKQAKQQKTFKGLLTSAQMAGKIAIPSRYIYDCVEQGALLDPSDYEFEVISKAPNRRRQSTLKKKDEPESNDEADNEAERKRIRKNEREAERRKAMKQRQEKEAKDLQERKVDAERQAEKVSSPTVDAVDVSKQVSRRTPTPPPEHTREMWGNGYKFSLAETQFALAYAELLVSRDHTISMNSVCNAIQKKLPHHTLGSWRTQLNKIAATEFEVWRKKSSIAFRKALRESQTAPPTPVISGVERVSPTVQPPVPSQNSNNTSHTDSDSLFQDDLNVISRYFVQADEDEPEESLWARLAATYHCHTSSCWEEFYQQYYEDVQKRHAEFVAEMGITE